jgi:hypothetical protein
MGRYKICRARGGRFLSIEVVCVHIPPSEVDLNSAKMGGGLSSRSRPASALPGAPKPAQSGSAALGAVLSRAGVTKVIMIRHANAKARDPNAAAIEAGTVLKKGTPFANAWTVGDLSRELTDKGAEQANAAKVWLDKHELRAVICSEATRAIATKEIMTAGKFPKGGTGCLTLHTLHPSRSGTPDCEKMFDTLGYGTLNTYFADTSVEGLEGKGREVFRGYMEKVTGELHGLIMSGMADFPQSGDAIAVFGHAVFLNAVAVAVSEAMGIENAEAQVAELELGEAQGIMCDAGAQSILLCRT